MNNNYTYCIGLMSGTSLDGIDLAYVKINNKSYADFEIIKANTFSYSNEWKKKLQESISYNKSNLISLDIEYGVFLGNLLNEFISINKITKLDFIASHGHTVLHQPEDGITLQIGSGEEIANITKKKIICDFRTQDVKFGGQGAPLVPIGDKLLFPNYEYCLNLGGFANVSYDQGINRIAFDICPVNIVLNHYTRKLGFEYDDKGDISSQGKINQSLLGELNSLNFYTMNPPKSLGLEWVQQEIFPLIDSLEEDIQTILRTFVEHIAMQIGTIIENSESVLVTGGGVFNSFLMKRIEFYAKTRVEKVNKGLIDYKEALIFSLLGLLRLDNQVNCLKSVTGAIKDHSSGEIYLPKID